MILQWVPQKIRELERELKKAGFIWIPGKGNHRKWQHQCGAYVVSSGNPAHDARRYQEKTVREEILKAQEYESKRN